MLSPHRIGSAVIQVLGICTALALGCTRGVVFHDVLGYAPDGERIAVGRDRGHTLELRDLITQRTSWLRGPLEPASTQARFVQFSSRGNLLVLYQSEYYVSRNDGYSVWDVSSGERVSRWFPASGDRTNQRKPSEVAISDDGRWIASGLEDGHLQIHTIDDERNSVQRAPDGWVMAVAFEPGNIRLAVVLEDAGRDEVVVYQPVTGVWQSVVRIPGASACRWVGQRLAVVTPSGLEVWDGNTTRLLTPDRGTLWRLDDQRIALSTTRDVRVFDVVSGANLLESRGVGQVWGAALRDARLVLLVERDGYQVFLIQLGLARGEMLGETSLGARAVHDGGAPLVYDGGGPHIRTVFVPALLPGGKYLDLVDPDDVHRLIPTNP